MIKVFECYAGYGGGSFALKKAGIDFECVGFSETHKGQIKIYEQNHKNIKNYGDITKIDINDLPDFDFITGGFPCQDVSIAGLRDLSKGRTNTVFKMLDIIKQKKPKYCLLENVEGILSMLNGELFAEIIRKLKSYGYVVSYKLLKSKDHGTPQNRPRVWIACEKNKHPFGFNPFPIKQELKLFVSDLLEKEVDEKYYLTQKQIARVIERSKIRNKPLGLRVNPKYSTTLTTRNPKHSPADSIFIESNIANTLLTGDYSKANYSNQFLIHSKQPRTCDPKKGGTGPLSRDDNISYIIDSGNSQFIEHKTEMRCLTPKECFRLMGFFNDEINIDGIVKTNAYYSAGNGWDVNLVSQILKGWIK